LQDRRLDEGRLKIGGHTRPRSGSQSTPKRKHNTPLFEVRRGCLQLVKVRGGDPRDPKRSNRFGTAKSRKANDGTLALFAGEATMILGSFGPLVNRFANPGSFGSNVYWRLAYVKSRKYRFLYFVAPDCPKSASGLERLPRENERKKCYKII
jgi:hypothetical protein